MFDFKKLQDGFSSLGLSLEKYQAKTLKANITTTLFSKLIDETKKSDEDLIAIAKVASKMADIIIKEVEK